MKDIAYFNKFFAHGSKDKPRWVAIIINLEMQQIENPGYFMSNRALFYVSKLITAQVPKGKSELYNKICPVYSIWIMPSKMKAGTRYKFKLQSLLDTPPAEYLALEEMVNIEFVYVDVNLLNKQIVCDSVSEYFSRTFNHLFKKIMREGDDTMEKHWSEEMFYRARMELKENGTEDFIIDKYCNGVSEEDIARAVGINVVEVKRIIRNKAKEEGILEGEQRGKKEGEDQYSKLIRLLVANNRNDDIITAANNPDYLQALFKEFNLSH